MSSYHGNSRSELHDLVPNEITSLLDVGCGEGAFGAALRDSRPALRVCGIEGNIDAVEVARSRYDDVLIGHYPEVAPSWGESFDFIAFNDVLEHMVDPWGALADSKRFLAPGGAVLVSLPNIASFGILRQLLRDEFTYTDYGVLDKTHLRFFTRKTAIDLAEHAGYRVRQVRHSWMHWGGRRGQVINRLGLTRLNGRQVVLLLEAR